MKYLSVCSGVEAATVAWHNLGWTPVAFSEFDTFPSAVLAHHYPDVPNLGDITKFKEWKLNEPIDLLVGGTPCQSFSVAGLRKGLEDPRGNLMLTYVGILDKFKPKWCVWENVLGVLSSNGGRDFGSFLGALVELGYGFSYRVLDAQNFGIPQRRRRVFVVGCLGDWVSPAKVLFEPNCLQGNTPKSRDKEKRITKYSGRGIAELCPTIGCELAKQVNNQMVKNAEAFYIPDTIVYETHPADSRVKEMGDICQTVTSRWGTGGGNVPIAVQDTSGRDKAQNGKGWSDENVSYTIDTTGIQGVAYSLQGNMIGRQDQHGPQGDGVNENISFTLNTTDRHAVSHNMAVRRLTPVECERLQGFPDNYTNIPWRKKDESPDGPRYKAMGNSMAVPVMHWIGQRIEAVEHESK
jgi:DNA (cytosine-5)-methyltransferase 1